MDSNFEKFVEKIGQDNSGQSSVLSILRKAIIKNILPQGYQLKQTDIARSLNVSHIPVREALKQLESEGFVVIYPNRGAMITSLKPSEIRAISDLRVILESGALRLSIPKMNDFYIEQAKIAYEKLCLSSEQHEEIESKYHFQFHDALYKPCENARLLKLIHRQHINIARYFNAFRSMVNNQGRIRTGHKNLLDACVDGDAELAANLIEKHINTLCCYLEENLEGGGISGE